MSEENTVTKTEEPIKRYVPVSNLLGLSVGLAGQNMCYGYISSWLFYYLTSVLKMDSVVVGIITSVSRAWDSINDPIVGAMVDKHKFKNGEKLRPFLIFTPPIIGILSALMFMPYKFGTTATIVIICALYLLWDLFYSFQDVALWGMIAVSSPLSSERARVAQWTTIGAGAGGTIAGLFQILRSFVSGSFGMSDTSIFAVFGLIFGLGGMLLSMTAYKMKENVETPKSEESIFEAIFVLRHNRTLLLISLARFFKDITQTLLPWAYFFESRENYNFGFASFDGGTTQVIYTFLTGAIGALSMFFVTKVSKKIGGMKRILVIAEISNILLRTIAYFIGFNSIGQIAAVMVLIAIVSIPTNMMDIAHRSLTSDSIDEVEYKTGKRTEGISYSVQNFISKIAAAVTLFFNGVILKALKYDNSKPNYLQGALYNKWMWPIFMVGPVIGQIIYLIVISFVKDDKETKQMIEAELHRRRLAMEEKEKELES
jgi:Na+/melibiose symporter-like transporter